MTDSDGQGDLAQGPVEGQGTAQKAEAVHPLSGGSDKTGGRWSGKRINIGKERSIIFYHYVNSRNMYSKTK